MGLELVESQLADHAPHEEVLSTISELRGSCLACTKLLDVLLEYEKLDSGLIEVVKTELDPVGFLQRAIATISILASRKSIVMSTSIRFNPREVAVCIDEIKIAQVLTYVLDNAIKFTPSGGTVKVKASVSKDRRYLVVEVIDTGCGISKANQEKLFTHPIQFHAKTQQSGGGSGLGLWISKRLMDLHEGYIKVHSDGEGLGSKVTVQLPLQQPGLNPSTRYLQSSLDHGIQEQQDFADLEANSDLTPPDVDDAAERSDLLTESSIAASKFSPKLMFHAPNQQSKNILIVDDSKLNRKMIRKSLEYYGFYTCFEADDGSAALEKVITSLETGGIVYDLITLDNNMAHLNGMEAAKLIRKAGYQGIIIGVTGDVFVEQREEFIACGANTVMSKPLNTSEFHAFVYEKLYGTSS